MISSINNLLSKNNNYSPELNKAAAKFKYSSSADRLKDLINIPQKHIRSNMDANKRLVRKSSAATLSVVSATGCSFLFFDKKEENYQS